MCFELSVCAILKVYIKYFYQKTQIFWNRPKFKSLRYLDLVFRASIKILKKKFQVL